MSTTVLNKTDFHTPHLNTLKMVSPRIDFLNAKGRWERAGSGILFADGDRFHVITAAHCVSTNPDTPGTPAVSAEKLRITLCLKTEMPYAVKSINIYDSSHDKDFALLEVDFTPEDVKDFDYINGIRFIGADIDTLGAEVAIYGYNDMYPTGHHLSGKCTATSVYHVNESFTGDCKNFALIKGFSGGGVFIQLGSVIYCMAYVKRIFNDEKHLDDIEVRYIPDLGSNNKHLWRAEMPKHPDQRIESFGNNKFQRLYNTAWNNLLKFFNENKPTDEGYAEKYKSLLQEIDKVKESYPRTKSVNIQDRVERTLFYNHSQFKRESEGGVNTEWSEQDKMAFGYVMRDRGVWPSLYGQLPEGLKDLNKKSYMRPVLQRAVTISQNPELENEQPDPDTDRGHYEMTMRAAFDFNFTKMKRLVKEWKPGDKWLAKKVMLESLWGKDSDFATNLDHLKDVVLNPATLNMEDRLVGTVIYNICTDELKNEIGYDSFREAGINAPSEVISDIGNKIDKVKNPPVPYGVHTITLYGDIDNDSFPESLRIIQYLIDSGLLPCCRLIRIVNGELWVKIFRHLFHNFPNVVVFYTLTYINEKLATLCGQEMAFSTSTEFAGKREKVLLDILKAITSHDTPPSFYRGLYRMAIELFPVVDPSVWFKDFIRAVSATLSAEDVRIETLTYRAAITEFIGEGMANLTSDELKIEILKLINTYFAKNPFVFSHTLSWAMEFNKDLVANHEAEAIIKQIIKDFPLSQTYPVIQKLNYNNCLSDADKIEIDNKLKKEGFEFAKNNSETISLLSYLVTDKDNVEGLKKAILSSWDGNYWNCGIEGRSFSSKGHLHLEAFDDKIEYNDSELEVIISNMKENIEKIKSSQTDSLYNTHIVHLTVDLLLSMKSFLDKPNVKNRVDYTALNKEIDELVLDLSKNDSLISMLASGDYSDVKHGILLLSQLIREDNFSKFHDEIGILINMALFKSKDVIELSLAFIAHLVEKFPSQMVSEFGTLLKLMIQSFIDLDYQSLHVHELNIRKDLEKINGIINCQPASMP